MKRIVLIVTLFFVSAIGLSQTHEIQIKFIGNCGLYMSDGNLNIYTDFPYKSGAYNYMKFDNTELDSIKDNSIFIFTHKHADHYSRKNLKKVLKLKNGQSYGSCNIFKLEQLSTPGFSVQAFRTKHRFSLRHYSYLITWHGKTIFFSGDTESAETIGKIKNMDWAFIPYWILYDAHENNIEIDAKMKGLYHLYPNQKIEGEFKKDIIVLKNQGEIIRIAY